MRKAGSKPSLAARLSRPLLAGAAATAAIAAPHDAVADIFLQLDGIKGESQDAKFKDAIDVLSYTQSFRNNATIGGGGGGPGLKVTCGAVTILKNVDTSSPKLIETLARGSHVPKGVLSFRTTGKDLIVYYKVTMTDVLVTAVDQTDNPDPGKIVEKVTLQPAKFKFEYTPQDAKGSAGPTVEFGYDCTTNRAF